MKKSTLITTIAMIVVVVVALSTATYAWFATANATTATVSYSTTGGADFSLKIIRRSGDAPNLTLGANDAPTASGSFTSAMSSTAALSTDMNGLWAPTAKIEANLPYTTSTASEASLAKFYEAQILEDQTKLKAAAGLKAMDVVNVINTSGASKDLYLTIIVVADGADVQNLYAAQAFSFYATVAKSGETTAAKYTSGYYIGADENDTKWAANNVVIRSTLCNTQQTASATIVKPSNYTEQQDAHSIYDGNAANFVNAAANTNLAVQDDEKVLQYNIPIYSSTDFADKAQVTIGLYMWIDGWVAESAASAASFRVICAFTSTSAMPISTKA